jgi:hypothetical protein
MKKQNPGNEDGHYSGNYQPIDFGAEFGTPIYQLANIVKYLKRHYKKDGLLDLKKAFVFLDNLIDNWKYVSYEAQDRLKIEYINNRLFENNENTLEAIAFSQIVRAIVLYNPILIEKAIKNINKIAVEVYGQKAKEI